MNISIINSRIINCNKGIVAHKSININTNDLYFERVDTCIEIINDDNTSLETAIPEIINSKLTTHKLNNSKNLEKQTQKIIRDLYNLEIKSKLQKDFNSLKKIRMLKGIIGSKKFHHLYYSLRSNL